MGHFKRSQASIAACVLPLYNDILGYQPFNEQEEADKRVILAQLASDPDCFDRSSLAHMACSIWTIDHRKTRTLMVHHNIYDSWSWIGGHADGEHDLAAVALRELEEETGVANARLADCGIYSLEVLTVDGHVKRGEYVSSHLHLNVTYLAIASPDEPLRIKPDENSGVKWVELDNAIGLSTEPWIAERIYRKLIDKLATVNLG
ncbi:NUDIX hydrolase [Raoultibacter timonensis]|uniref:NUDIX hydrolase n=1 Tax=Raoultibacter timonensis TaxID=1907662 RepID=UPI000C85209F|nr:NUDIX hydrolase [Raoultibacter timonensis]